MKIMNKSFIALIGLFLLLYILPLGVRPLVVPDESRYAEIPREMIGSGDWVVPHLNGLQYFEKPAFGYWVLAGSILLFGESNFAVRLPSAMAVGLSGLLIYVLVFQMCRNENEENRLTAILAALTFFTCFAAFGLGNIALLDSLFSFFLTATITAFYFASEAPPGFVRKKRFLLLLSGVSCGLAFLTKRFLAFAVPVLVLAPYLVWQRRYRDLWRMSWLPILVAVLVCLPWGILIHLREPDFWRFFFFNEHIRRFMTDSAQHPESFKFFFMYAPFMFMPWTFMIPAAAAGVRKLLKVQGPQGRLIRLSICWLALPFLFFSFSRGKLLAYIFPCFPPFAILMALGLLHALKKEERHKYFQWGATASAMFFGLTLLAFVYVQFFGYNGFRPYSQPYKALMAVGAVGFMVVSCFWAFRSRERIKKIILFGLSPVLLFLTVWFILPDLTIEKKSPGILLERYRPDNVRDALIISDDTTVSAVCWYLKRSDVYVLGDGGELDYGLAYEDAACRRLDIQSVIRLINNNRGNTVLVAQNKNMKKWQDQLPLQFSLDSSGPEGFLLWRY